MREIKFRAWDKDQYKMVEQPYFFEVYHYSDGNRVNQKDWRYYEDLGDLEDGRGYLCEIMQFTGLKDKNGTEIYEGDILSADGYPYIDEGKQNYVAVVEFVFAGFQTVSHCVSSDKRGISDGINEYLEEGGNFEVIGNIYENENLLKLS